MIKRTLSFLLAALLAVNAYAGGSQPTTWPATGNLVVSNGSYAPAGIAPVNGSCLVGSGGAWTTGACGGGSVSVTAASPDVVITPSPGTGTFTVGTTNLIVALGTATSPTIQASYMGKTVTHNSSVAVAVSLPQAGTTGFEAGKSFCEVNLGSGLVTVTPVSPSTVNTATTIVLNQNESTCFISDGSSYIAPNGKANLANYPQLGTANTFTAANAVTPVTVSISTSTYTPNFSASNNFNITLSHAACPCTLANPTNVTPGQSGVIVVNQSGSGSDLITSYGTNYVFTNGTAPTLSTGAGAQDVFSYYVIDSTHIRLAPLIASTKGVTTEGLIASGTKFTTSGCSVSATAGGATAGTFTSGTAGTCTVTITMNGATGLTAPNGWACSANDQTNANTIRQTASTTTTATLSGTTSNADVISFSCTGY